MNKFFNNIKKNFGFGCMRFPLNEKKEVDVEQTKEMIDLFIKEGFNYFDTAHVYLGGNSELVLKECLTSRYPRESFVLVNKLSSSNFDKEEDLELLFNTQLEACGVDYFDFYLMHAQSGKNFGKYQKTHAYEFAFKKKQEGKIKHVGISFHDTSDVLEYILNTYPEIEVVQIQLNYVDYDDQVVQGKKCYEVCVKHNKPVIIMEPVKGGNLVNLPEQADQIFRKLNNGSNASYAIRYAASFDNVMMVLSGMSTIEQMKDNLSYMKNFIPLNEKEYQAIEEVTKIFKEKEMIPCTSCRYCIDGCPMKISIPDLFACLNSKRIFNDWNANFYYNEVHTKNNAKASACIKCGKCEQICPQHLPIRELLEEVKKEFEK